MLPPGRPNQTKSNSMRNSLKRKIGDLFERLRGIGAAIEGGARAALGGVATLAVEATLQLRLEVDALVRRRRRRQVVDGARTA